MLFIPQGLSLGGYSLESGSITAGRQGIHERFPKPPRLPTDPILTAQSRRFATAICAEPHALTVQCVRRHLSDTTLVDEDLIGHRAARWNRSTPCAFEEVLRARNHATWFCFAEFQTLADLALAAQPANAGRFDGDVHSYSALTEIEVRRADLSAHSLARAESQIDCGSPVSSV
ncbi:MAG: hypothetical protein AAF501_01915 [Pseudomonadota bacterium]